LFLFLFRNASSPIDFLRIPAERVIELGTRITL
jgi:KUP system potassium uptake protein